MNEYKFRFYISGQVWSLKGYTLRMIYLPTWKMAHKEADEYPTNKFIEIANI
jgi:hypothetical protein